MAPSRRWSLCVCLLFLASALLVLSSALPPPPPRRWSPPDVSADDALYARLCHPRGSRPAAMPLPWCHELSLRRRRGAGHHHHHRRPLPLPPPGRDEVDVRYGVAKRLVPTGPNPLHN